MSIITMRSRRFPANSASDCLRFAKFRPQFSESYGATYTHICEMFSALQSRPYILSSNRFWKQGPNRFIIDDTIVPKTGTKLTKKTRLQIWRSVVAPSDAIEKNRNIGAQLQSILYTTVPKRFGEICFLYDFWCAQTSSFRAVFGLPIWNLTLAVSAR